MHDALEFRTASRRPAALPAAACAHRPGVRRRLRQEAPDDWHASRHRGRP